MKNLSVVIAEADAARGNALCEALEGASDGKIRVEASACVSLEALYAQLSGNVVDAILIGVRPGGAFDSDTVSRLNQRYGDLAILVLSPAMEIERELEWVHRGAQEVLPDTAAPLAIMRAVLLSMERKHLYNDVQQALRLEQETVVKMQGFIDQLVGYATRSSLQDS